MKTWKHFTFVTIFVIIGIVVGFTSCDDSNGKNDPTPDPREILFGTWERDDGSNYFLTINHSLMKARMGDVPFWTAGNLKWTEADNDNEGEWYKKTEYPSGYTVNATFTTHSSPDVVGELFSVSLFINATKNKLLMVHEDSYNFFTKKEEI